MNGYSSDVGAGALCEVSCVDGQRVQRAMEKVPSSGALQEQAEIFKLLGDPGRLRILYALGAEELCVCDLAALLESSPSAISHQLRLLRAARLVCFRKMGKMVYYRLDDRRVHTWLAMTAASAEVQE